jgi:hypothetical protein
MQRNRRDLFVEPNRNRIKVFTGGHHLQPVILAEERMLLMFTRLGCLDA